MQYISPYFHYIISSILIIVAFFLGKWIGSRRDRDTRNREEERSRLISENLDMKIKLSNLGLMPGEKL